MGQVRIYKREEGVLRQKSYAFALRIVKMVEYLRDRHSEKVLSNQVLSSGTSIGALVREAEFAQSLPDFTNKLAIALKEANETEYWLQLLWDTHYIEDEQAYLSIKEDCDQLIALLVASLKTSKRNRLKKQT